LAKVWREERKKNQFRQRDDDGEENSQFFFVFLKILLCASETTLGCATKPTTSHSNGEIVDEEFSFLQTFSEKGRAEKTSK
jgi:hypothetical protein